MFDGKKVTELIPDELTLMNPFDYGEDAIHVQFQVNRADYDKLKQFCYAKGIYGASIIWLTNNPYMKPKEEKEDERDIDDELER